MSDRDEIDARQHRCDQAQLRGSSLRDRYGFSVDERQPTVLSFEEAKIAGLAMHDRWLKVGEDDPEVPVPPLRRDDAAWADMARAAWEAIWAKRRGD